MGKKEIDRKGRGRARKRINILMKMLQHVSLD
jgi:hypothetical protein